MPSTPAFPILSVPHLYQPATGECLPACAAMVLSYLGVSVNYRRLLPILRTQSGYGTPFSNIRQLTQLKVAVHYGRGTLKDLQHFLRRGQPVLTPVQTSELPHWTENTAHAVVVVGMDEKTVYINDPAFANAPIQVPHGDFDLAWLEQDEYYAILAS